jgi:hypothetical protein
MSFVDASKPASEGEPGMTEHCEELKRKLAEAQREGNRDRILYLKSEMQSLGCTEQLMPKISIA